MDSQKTDDGEVPQHPIQRFRTIITSHSHRLFSTLHRRELFIDLRSLNEGVENIENAVASPCIRIVSEKLDFLCVGALACNFIAVRTKVIELVNKFINDIPSPEVLVTKVSNNLVIINMKDLTEGGSRSTGPSEFNIK